jgi:hypothetical protein
VAAELHCSSVCVGLNLLLKSLCWLKLLVLEFVLAETSYSRVCLLKLLVLEFVFAQISYSFYCDQICCSKKKKKKKKKKKSENFYEPYHQRGCIHHYSYSFIRFYYLILILVLVLVSWT